MIKNNFAGKAVKRAIYIGLAAVVAASSPMATLTSFAEEVQEVETIEDSFAAEEMPEESGDDSSDEAKESETGAVLVELPLEVLGVNLLNEEGESVDESENAAEESVEKSEDAAEEVAESKNFLEEANEKLTETDKKLDEAIENKENDLTNAIEELGSAVENLENSTENLEESLDIFKGELEDLKDATGEFVDAVKDVYYTQKDLNDLYKQYEVAQEAFKNAEEALKEAEAAKDEIGDEQYKELTENFNNAVAEAERLQNEYASIVEFNESLKTDIESENYDEASKKLVEKYVAVDEGQTVEIVNSEAGFGTYGEDGNANYVVVKNAEGVVVSRYSYEFTDGSFVIKELVSETPDGYYVIGDTKYAYNGTQNEVKIDDETTLEIKGSGDDLYYTTDVEKKEVDDTSKPTVTVTGGDYGDGITFDLNVNPGEDPSFEVKGVGTLYVNSENKIYKKGKLFGKEFKAEIPYVNAKLGYKQKPQVIINGTNYDVTGDDTNGYTANGLTLIKNDDGSFSVKNSVSKEVIDPKDKVYNLKDGDSLASDSASSSNQAELSASYENAKTDLANKTESYNAAKEVFDNYAAALDKLEAVKPEADRTNLVVKREIKVIDKTITYGDLADLPRSVLDVISLDKVFEMDETERKEVVENISTIVSSQNDAERIAAMVKLVSQMGGTNTDAYVALGVALATGEADSQLDQILDSIGSKYIKNLVKSFIQSNEAATPFQKEYAQAWMKALMAKVNVVKEGIELVHQAGETANAGMAVIKACGTECGAAADVTAKALQVAVNATELGALKASDAVVEITNTVVGKTAGAVSTIKKSNPLEAVKNKKFGKVSLLTK